MYRFWSSLLRSPAIVISFSAQYLLYYQQNGKLYSIQLTKFEPYHTLINSSFSKRSRHFELPQHTHSSRSTLFHSNLQSPSSQLPSDVDDAGRSTKMSETPQRGNIQQIRGVVHERLQQDMETE